MTDVPDCGALDCKLECTTLTLAVAVVVASNEIAVTSVCAVLHKYCHSLVSYCCLDFLLVCIFVLVLLKELKTF